ncbi:hypothetical protein [Enterococcus sp. BWR-S5]|uniref:hypothetical protein n=1 Tax=Enterococcus sp. BWR-S5 TaxID=2787714 RepID=UPI0019234301|nr:hypothetical protein [Enterococcus sp. BWR-S5]MBL1226507.1 hypothetical protein [Enterococcus sp. BWR-S5]
MKRYIGVVLVVLIVLVGCGESSKSSQGEAIVEAVFEYNSNENENKIHYERKQSNVTVYESGSDFYVLMEKQKVMDSGTKTVTDSIYRVRKHDKFSVSQSDIEQEYNEDILKDNLSIIYEEENVDLVDEL